MGASAAREPTMEEILASIRRIIEPDGDSSAGLFASLSPVEDAPVQPAPAAPQPVALSLAAVAEMAAVEFDAPKASETAEAPARPEPAALVPQAIEAVEPLVASRPWGVEANDAAPKAAVAEAPRSPIAAGVDRFASALQRLNRRSDKAAAVLSTHAVARSAAAPAAMRVAGSNALREETTLAVAKLRAVAETMSRPSGAAVARVLAPVPVVPAPAFEPERPVAAPEVAELVQVVPPPPANDQAERRAEAFDGFDEGDLLVALREEMEETPPPAPKTALAVPAPRLGELGDLIAAEAGTQAASAFTDLASAIRGGTMGSMDEMARELLAPMLREWMDDNLPVMVERMVREEIRRAARGGLTA